MFQIASPYKIAAHRAKITAYLKAEPIFPATLELDITSRCTRICRNCPSSRSKKGFDLAWDFIDSLLASLEGQTQGLLLTGGEPTSSPRFADVLALARKRGFREIAVVTNGALLDRDDVREALLGQVTTLRISLYDWEAGTDTGFRKVLGSIGRLRAGIDRTGSPLRIGVSALTSQDRSPLLARTAESVREAGAHWIYFHPACRGWDEGRPAQVKQDGVPEAVIAYQKTLHPNEGFQAYFSSARYLDTEIRFTHYHAAHFLLVIGADGLNYLGPEVKYQPRHVLGDAAEGRLPDFLWRPERLAKIEAVTSPGYPAIRSRHRGVLYNDVIQRMIDGRLTHQVQALLQTPGDFLFPHIL